MNLLEHEAKKLLVESSIAVASSQLVAASSIYTIPNSIALPAVVKSQVPTGGRGKAGGIRVVHAPDELSTAITEIGGLEIGGHIPTHLLIEELIDIQRELYLSLTVNRLAGTIDLIAHPDGGIEVESQSGFTHITLTGKNATTVGESLAELYGLESHAFALADLVENLYRCFVENDATLLEINPLILTKQGELVAGDCKMTLDDAAAFRHPDWDFEEQPASASFVSLDPRGTVATVANGAGLAMATVDAVAARGLVPANFLDIGGAATVESVLASFRQIMEFPEVNSIVINIFGGIVQCDKVAEAIIAARQQLPGLPQLYIRLSGTNAAEARELLATHDLPLYDSLDQALGEIVS